MSVEVGPYRVPCVRFDGGWVRVCDIPDTVPDYAVSMWVWNDDSSHRIVPVSSQRMLSLIGMRDGRLLPEGPLRFLDVEEEML